MPKMIVVNESRYKELCSDYLHCKKKYKQALVVISDLLKRLERRRKRAK